jgi:nitrogen-specific signal transduction histidine kinase
MSTIQHRNFWKSFLFLFAVLIGLGSLIFTRNLVRKLKVEELENVEMWAEATRLVALSDTSQNVIFLSLVIENNNTVPVILTDESDSIISARNFDKAHLSDNKYLRKTLEKIKEKRKPLVINLENGHYNLIYYKDSTILSMLIYYPYIQLGIILLFILVSFQAVRSSRKADQNQVWVGMSKETAHQLGTPTSSLSGWIEVLQQKYPDLQVIKELSRDVERLEKVTERFSRIGSKPALSDENIVAIITHTVDYLKSRTSSKIRFINKYDALSTIIVPVNTALFEWVIENLCKNAIDAMEGEGELTIKITKSDRTTFIDISDTGKGIPKSAFKKIFNPGFTTKQRGWGLGLSLARRIIEEYHHGKIFVRHSEMGKGSCIRIIMNNYTL